MSSSDFKVTDNTHEMSFHELFSQTTQVRIPLFQREYVWTAKQLNRLIEEANIIVDGEDKNRFLGAIIAVKRDANPASPQPYEIVDGQQRLTTLYLFCIAGAYVAAKNGHDDYAIGLINSHLAIDWYKEGPNTKLISSFADQKQLIACFRQLLTLGNISDIAGPRVRLPHPTGPESGRLLTQFNRIRSLLQKRYEKQGFEYLQQIITAVQTKLTFVFILLKDASNATTVFEGLNDPGVPIGIGDLVRNEVFSRVQDKPELAEHVHANLWLPFKESLGDHFDDFFFPFGIVKDPSIGRADLFKGLRKQWSADSSPAEIIDQLEEFVPQFNALTKGIYPENYPKSLRSSLTKLRELGAPSSTYPFLLRLLKGWEEDEFPVEALTDVIFALECFLVRRAIAGIEPTGLLVFFRTAWSNMEGEVSASAFARALRKRGTIEWPDDQRIQQAILARRIYKASMRNYLLKEFDRSLGADVPTEEPWVEHVMPNKLSKEWQYDDDGQEVIEPEMHDRLKDTWGNLVCLSNAMNIELSQSRYAVKRPVFAADSMYKSARALAGEFKDWGPEQIQKRSTNIAEWATGHWKSSADLLQE